MSLDATVFIPVHQEPHEGAAIYGVYSSLAKALEVLQKAERNSWCPGVYQDEFAVRTFSLDGNEGPSYGLDGKVL